MFKKFMAKLGKGAATVDLRYENRSYFAGETLSGVVVIHGGEVEQNINQLSVRFMIKVRTKRGESVTRKVSSHPLSGPFTIRANEEKHFDFTYTIPHDLPLSRGSISYFFDTHLDIQGGLDHIDVDPLTLEAPRELEAIFNALGNLGFREKPTSGKVDSYGQEFSFFPTAQFAGQVNEFEIRVSSEEAGEHVYLEIDCRNGYQELEAKREFVIDHRMIEQHEELTRFLQKQIEEVLEQPHLFTNPFSYRNQYAHSGSKFSGVGGMVGGLAAGVLGGVLLSEMIDGLDIGGMVDGAADALGIDEDTFDLDEQFQDFGGFFDGGDE
jgi:sporulation-control protein